MTGIVPGQRWMSEAEPELGLGVVVDLDERSIAVAVAGCGKGVPSESSLAPPPQGRGWECFSASVRWGAQGWGAWRVHGVQFSKIRFQYKEI